MKREIENQFHRLGEVVPIGSTFLPVTEEELTSIETVLGNVLPEDYREFLQTFGAASFGELVEIRLTRSSPLFAPDVKNVPLFEKAPLSHFYGAMDGNQSLAKRITTYRDRIPETMIPIADDGGGHQICLGINGKEQGKVYYWDHGNEPLDEDDYLEEYGEPRTPEAIFQNVYMIAESFEDFLRRLEVRSR
jgi:SMI1-KNR4 cell-wall